jgi:DNA-binding transcriptional LysR family regulator
MPDDTKISLQAKSGQKRIDWRLLEYFRVAGQRQHITRAAEELGTSQPALSRALARLEKEVGVPLFERAGRSVCLTRYGLAFLSHIERALREIEDGHLELIDLINPGRGTIALGFLRSLGAALVPRLVREFRDLHPQVRFTFVSNNSIDLADKLVRGDLDLIFLGAPSDKPPFAWQRVATQELTLIVAESHPLARRRQVSLTEIADQPLLTFQRGHAVRILTDELCKAAGFTPTVVFEGDDSSVIRGFVAAGFGVAVTPPENAAGPGVVALKITNPAPRRDIGIAWLKERYLPGSVRLFRDFCTSTKRTDKIIAYRKR